MTNPDPEEIARMLRKPEGEFGLKVAGKMNESNALIIQWAIDKLELQENEEVLEIGFGNGSHIQNLLEKRKGIRYTGLDFSETMVTIARERHQHAIRSGQVSIHLGSSDAMPFPPETFNKIFTVNTLYFWEDPDSHLQQIFDVLRPGGVFCVAFKSRTFMRHLPFTPHGFTLYEQDEVISLLKSNKFVIEEVSYYKEAELEIAGKRLTPDAVLIAATKSKREKS